MKGVFLTLYLFIYLKAFCTQACSEGIGTNGTHRSHARWHPYPNPNVQLFSNSGVGSFTSLKNRWMKVLWDGTYRFSSLSEKIRKSNRLQISLQGRHFLPSYLKTPSVGPIGVWTRDLPLSRPALSQLSSPPLAAVTLLLAAVNKGRKIRYPPSKISAKTSKCNKQHFLVFERYILLRKVLQ